MTFDRLFHISTSLLKYYTIHKRTPLTVSYLSTYRCNQKCSYCDWTKKKLDDELNTEESIALIRSLKKNGVVKLGFAGGESLCRSDIDDLMQCAHNSGLVTSISSNGREIKNHIQSIKKYVDVVQLSLDGDTETHDALRGSGSYDIVIEAINLLTSNSVKVITNTVLTKKNLNQLNWILQSANKMKTIALFQPVFNYGLSAPTAEIDQLAPTYSEMEGGIKFLLAQKKRGMPIGNSVAFLKYVQHTWGSKKPFRCKANDLFCTINPSGTILPCCFCSSNEIKYNANLQGFKKAFEAAAGNRFSKDCYGCYCNAYIESNLAFCFHPSACLNALTIV